MCELAAIAGCRPDDYTLRELDLMARAADQARWCRTFALLAQIFNANRAEDSEAIDPMQFYLWSEKEAHGGNCPPPPSESQRAELRDIFPKK